MEHWEKNAQEGYVRDGCQHWQNGCEAARRLRINYHLVLFLEFLLTLPAGERRSSVASSLPQILVWNSTGLIGVQLHESPLVRSIV